MTAKLCNVILIVNVVFVISVNKRILIRIRVEVDECEIDVNSDKSTSSAMLSLSALFHCRAEISVRVMRNIPVNLTLFITIRVRVVVNRKSFLTNESGCIDRISLGLPAET